MATTTPQERFDELAPEYDRRFTGPMFQAEEEVLFEMLAPYIGEIVLDVGCGTGLFLDYHKPAVYSGIDISSGMLAEAERKHTVYEGAFFKRDFEKPFKLSIKFDTVISFFDAFTYSLNPRATIQEMHNSLRPGGHAIVHLLSVRYDTRKSYVNKGKLIPCLRYTYQSSKALFEAFFEEVEVIPFHAFLEDFSTQLPKSVSKAWLKLEMKLLRRWPRMFYGYIVVARK